MIQSRANSELVQAQMVTVATKIIDGINNVSSDKNAWGRWVWELIQNAKDTSIGTVPVKIEIIHTEKEVCFKHSGKPFTIKNLVSLMSQTSLKERTKSGSKENPETTGKFGTGFITTHLLSRIILLKGVFFDETSQRYQQFNLTMDRSENDPEMMIQKYRETQQIFQQLDDKNVCPYIENYVPCSGLDTQFTYILDNERTKIALAGVREFEVSIPFVLSFNKQIEYVSFQHEGKKVVYKSNKKNIEKGLDIVQIDGMDFYLILSHKSQWDHAAIQINKTNEGIKLVQRKLNAPSLYVDFPLIGSDKNFSFPFTLNSHNFIPNEPRSKLNLLMGEYAKINLQILSNLIQSIFQIIRYLKNQNCQDLHFLFDLIYPNDPDLNKLQTQFYIPYMNELSKLQIIQTFSDQLVSFQEVSIPDYDRNNKEKTIELCEIIGYFNKKMIKPKFDYIILWSDLLDNPSWQVIRQSESYKITIKSVINKIESFQNLGKMRQSLNLNYQQCITLLNLVYNYLIRYEFRSDLVKKAIFLNQKHIFCKRDQLSNDKITDGILKNIVSDYGYDIGTKLILKECNNTLITTEITQNDIKQEINNCYRDYYYNSSKNRNVYQPTQKTSKLNTSTLKDLQQLSLELSSLIPVKNDLLSDSLMEERKKLIEERNKFINLIKSIKFINQKEIREVNDDLSEIYQFSDFQVLSLISEKVKSFKTIPKGDNYFASEEQFFTFYKDFLLLINSHLTLQSRLNSVKQNQIQLKEQLFLPNQKGVFCQIEELYLEQISYSDPPDVQVKNNQKLQEQEKEFTLKNAEQLKLSSEKLKNIHSDLYNQSQQNQIEIRSKLIHQELTEIFAQLQKITTKVIPLKQVCEEIDRHFENFTLTLVKNCRLSIMDLDREIGQLSSIAPKETQKSFRNYFKNKVDIVNEVFLTTVLKENITECVRNGNEESLKKLSQIRTEQGKKNIEKFMDIAENPQFQKYINELFQVSNGQQNFSQILDGPKQEQINESPQVSNRQQNSSQIIDGPKVKEQINEQFQVSNRQQIQEPRKRYEKENEVLELFVVNCITNEQQLIALTSKEEYYVNNEYRQQGYSYVHQILQKSIKNVKKHLSYQYDYDITNWQVINSINSNIIEGVKKKGNDIYIVIRPTNNGKVTFHNDHEIEYLTKDSCELWGNNGKRSELLTLGRLLEFNSIRELKVI